MSNENALVVHEPATITKDALSVDDVLAQVQTIQQVQAAAMRDGEHYGVIPGTPKPSLWKPGAEKLCLTFRLDPQYEEQEQFFPDGHYYVKSTCTLFHIPTQLRIASGVGSCTTRESKYAYRNAQRVCPECDKPYLLKSKQKPEWFCWNNPSKDKHGCGAKFPENDPRIVDQEQGKVDNPDLPDTYNTVLKMASKRALVAAVLNGTAASDIFTQDLEDKRPEPVHIEARVVEKAPQGPDDDRTPPLYSSPPGADWGDPDSQEPPAVQAWVDALEAVYGAPEVINAAETLRQRLGTGSPIKSLAPLHKLRPDDPRAKAIVEALEGADVEEAEVVDEVSADRPCPECGSGCGPHKPDDPKAPSWICSNQGCDADGQGHRWTSFSNDPWKPGGELERIAKAKESWANPEQAQLGGGDGNDLAGSPPETSPASSKKKKSTKAPLT